jgi:uncharacterized protein (DUF1501 family)
MTDVEAHACEDYSCTRRRLLAGGAAVAGIAALELATPTLAFAQGKARGDLLVVVSLRGGADGLSFVPPIADHGYYANRHEIAIQPGQAIRLDRTFGLHPGLKPLLPYWRDKRLAIVQAVGDSDGSRSHFEAADAMERGVNNANGISNGWVDRHLHARGLRVGDFPSLAIGGRPPGSLYGGSPALALYDVKSLRVQVSPDAQARTAKGLGTMYSGLSGSYADAGRETLGALKRLGPLTTHDYVARPGVRYPQSQLGFSLSQIAAVARAGVGLEVATLDSYGWDTHVGMGGATGGYMAGNIGDFGQSLAAFAADLGPLLATTTIVTMTEFGRRVGQNGSGGVDHGHGSAMMVLGGGIRGGKVYGRWPGLGAKQLEQGDLAVTTDYRDVLGEIIHRRLGGVSNLSRIFPDHRPHELGLAKQR